MADQPMPAIGTTAVHKDDHAKSVGPVWSVNSIHSDEPKPIYLTPARKNKMNDKMGVDPYQTRTVTPQEFKDDYVQL